jgi:signal transduction histidine kinase
LNRETVNLAELFRSELDRVAPGTPLHVKAPFPSLQLNGDAARLRILLRNLVLNAQQHGVSDDGLVHLQVILDATDAKAILQVSDQGPGIGKEHLDEVSDPFYRPDASRNRGTGGFGMGLTLARLIAEAHDGTLHIDSDPTTRPGTRITVAIPRLRQPLAQQSAHDE